MNGGAVVVAPLRSVYLVQIGPTAFINLDYLRSLIIDVDDKDNITGVSVQVEGMHGPKEFGAVHKDFVQEVLTICQNLRLKGQSQIVQAAGPVQ